MHKFINLTPDTVVNVSHIVSISVWKELKTENQYSTYVDVGVIVIISNGTKYQIKDMNMEEILEKVGV